jgi:serine/threonine protein kinase
MASEENPSATQTCPACGTVIDTAKAQPLARVPCPKCGEKVRAERTFDHFVLVETLGVGGMGTVYKARDMLLDRFVALKLLRQDLGTGIDHAAQLQQEARVAASVNHPNVVQVFSSGTDHGQFYLVMELVDHGSLDDFIEQQTRLPEEQVLESGIQVAKGLRAAHRKGLIHCDVKPANILFVDEHTAKIGDFGLAGVAAEGAETRSEIWATPYYVAPERLNNELPDFRSDIYSLGATLFHAIAGKAPIEGDTKSAVALRELKNRPLDLRKIVPEVSEATARVFHRMLAPEPAQRFSSYDELVAELEGARRFLNGKEDVDLAKPQQNRRPILAIAAAALVALIGIAGFLFVRKAQERTTSNTLLSSTLENLRAMTGKLKTRNAASGEPSAERESARHRLAGGEEGRAPSQGEGRMKIVDLERASWNAALANYKEHVAIYDFRGAGAAINAVQITDSGLKKSQTTILKKAQWLADWKSKLIVDLTRAHFSGLIVDIDGVRYNGIVGADPEKLMLKTRYGIVGLPWVKLQPKKLLAVSASFIWPEARDAVDRQWLCAVFASETGQRDAARRFAESAAKAKPKYREQIPLLLPGPSPSR